MSLDTNLTIRVNEDELKKFKTWCETIGRNHSQMLRELITACPENRVSLSARSKTRTTMNSFYK